MSQLKILIEMKHGLGDCVCMLPAIKAVRNHFPDAYIALIVNGKANEEIFRHSGISIDRFYYFSLKNRSKLYTLETLWKLHREHFDIGVLATMTPKKKGIGLFKLLGIKRCFGEQYQGLNFLDLDNQCHFVDQNLAVIEPLTGVVSDRQPHLYVKEQEFPTLAQQLSKMKGSKIAINIGGADKNYYKGQYVYTRNWKKESMHELVKLCSQNKNWNIILLGGKLEEELLHLYQDILSNDNVINFVNKTSVSESIFILSQCDCSIGVDTGMQHVADALGKTTISIFGPTNPKTHGAYSGRAIYIEHSPKLECQYCFDQNIYYTCQDRKCLNEILAKGVFDKVEEVVINESSR